MKHICFFSGDITRGGGTERVATAVANGLARLGKYKVSFLSLVQQRETPFYPIEPGIPCAALTQSGKWVRPGPGYLPFLPKLRRFLKTRQVDVAVDIDIVLDALTLPAAAGLGVRVISWEHFAFQFEQSVPYRRMISRLTARFADDIVTLTAHDRGNYQETLHRKNRIVTIENPVRFPAETSAKREKLILTVGRLEYGKGTDLLAGVIPEVLRRCEGWRWCFLGEGEGRGALEAVRREHGLGDRLLLPGVVQDVEGWLLRSSLMVMASRSEGLSMCLLEARACQVPCIAFDVPVAPGELIRHGGNGFLVPPFDTVCMAGRIVQLAQDDALRGRFSDAAAEGMEPYRLDAVLEKWVRLLEAAGGP